MRPTLRGAAAIVIVAASFAMAVHYSPRALNAIVTPLLVVLVAGVLTTVRIDRPAIRRVPVAEGFIGERRTVGVEVRTGSAVAATVRDAVGNGMTVVERDAADVETDDGDPVVATTLEGDDRVTYDVRLEERGEHEFGPLTITVTDVFGLFKRRFTYDEPSSVLVYPRVYDLRGGPGRDLATFVDRKRRNREEFDHLREYQRGDALRDVHWKSAAKRTDASLVVTEYADDEETGSVTVAGECTPGRADELATAVASVATRLLEAGVDVGVALPESERPPGSGQDHHYDLLSHLARLEAGELEDERWRDADVRVRVDADGSRVIFEGRSIPFDRFTGSGTEAGVDPASRTQSEVVS